MVNQLKNEKSPYLKQHENNPVNWLPWNKETLLKAKNKKKPIFFKCWLCKLSLVSCNGT